MRTRIRNRLAMAIALMAMMGGCTFPDEYLARPPTLITPTPSLKVLTELPPARQRVVTTVYRFNDLTGQHKPNDLIAEYSRAVTQGAASILIDALLAAGTRGWFSVVEREGLQNLLQERQLIRATRTNFAGPDGRPLPDVGPLLYAGVIMEGGIVGYDSNTVTGGLGARYLGVGGSTEYRRDHVSVYLRAVSSQTGEVLVSVSAEKTIYSVGVQANVFKFVSFDDLLEIDTGFTRNEPTQLAVRQAIELAVYALIMEGALRNLWQFANPTAGQAETRRYVTFRDGQREKGLPAAEMFNPTPPLAPRDWDPAPDDN